MSISKFGKTYALAASKEMIEEQGELLIINQLVKALFESQFQHDMKIRTVSIYRDDEEKLCIKGREWIGD